jgi:hypothetical protein
MVEHDGVPPPEARIRLLYSAVSMSVWTMSLSPWSFTWSLVWRIMSTSFSLSVSPAATTVLSLGLSRKYGIPNSSHLLLQFLATSSEFTKALDRSEMRLVALSINLPSLNQCFPKNRNSWVYIARTPQCYIFTYHRIKKFPIIAVMG